MTHQTKVSVLSQLHLQQAREIKSQSDEIKHLSTLLEKQQAILERVQEQQSQMPEMPFPQNPFTFWGTPKRGIQYIALYSKCQTRCWFSAHLWNFPRYSGCWKVHFEKNMAEEATWASHSHPHHVHFASDPQGDSHLPPEHILRSEDPKPAFILPHIHPDTKWRLQWQEFCKPKINKLKGGYSAMANLIFQLWLTDIKVYVDNWNLTEREATQLVKDLQLKEAMMK